tara:strand:- start:17291 stop:17776 length:486 start_codon:yes stop_codon:yes gene_type:complete
MGIESGKTLKEQLSNQIYTKPKFDNNFKVASQLSKNVEEGTLSNQFKKGKDAVRLGSDAYSAINKTVDQILSGTGNKDITDIIGKIHGDQGKAALGTLGGAVKDLATFDYSNARQGDVALNTTKVGARMALNALGPPGMIMNGLWSLAEMFGQKSGGYKGY